MTLWHTADNRIITMTVWLSRSLVKSLLISLTNSIVQTKKNDKDVSMEANVYSGQMGKKWKWGKIGQKKTMNVFAH